MATVYLAEDLKHDRKVALKVLRPELAASTTISHWVEAGERTEASVVGPSGAASR